MHIFMLPFDEDRALIVYSVDLTAGWVDYALKDKKIERFQGSVIAKGNEVMFNDIVLPLNLIQRIEQVLSEEPGSVASGVV